MLVQSNFGGILQMNGAPLGIELGQYSFSDQVRRDQPYEPANDVQAGGSIMIVVATNAPLSDRTLERVAPGAPSWASHEQGPTRATAPATT